jgi:hypothetical protein
MYYVFRKTDGWILQQVATPPVVGKAPHLDILEVDHETIPSQELKWFRVENGKVVRHSTAGQAVRSSEKKAARREKIREFWQLLAQEQATVSDMQNALRLLAAILNVPRR